MAYFEILCGAAVLITALYYYFTSKFDFWKDRNIPGPKPVPLFGNVGRVMLGKQHMGLYVKEVYETYPNEPMVGIYIRTTPVLILNDPDLIKDVLIKDFNNFASRGLTLHEKAEPLSVHLFNLEPKRWKPIRTRLTPVFTSSKLKEMFKLIVECSEHLEKYLETLTEKGEPIECRELTARFTTDVIGRCAFGLEMNALTDENSEFRTMGRKIFSVDFYRLLRFRIRQSLPWLYDLLGTAIGQTEEAVFLTKSIQETMAYRKKNNIVINDFVNVLIELKENPEKLENIELTENLLVAQAFIFFAAGFETSSTTISHVLYEMAVNPSVQETLRKEIIEHEKIDGDLKYENIKDMKYLDQVFRETLRKYPPATFLMRESLEPYTFKGTKVTIPKKCKVWIPTYALQHDPEIFPNPDKFIPERFNEENSASRHPMYFLPFGDGPRNCIGARFAVYQTKVGIIKILRKYRVQVCEKTRIPYELNPNAFILAPKDGIYLKIEKI